MDLDALISEICTKVQARIAACENNPEECICKDSEDKDKPVLVVLAEKHGEICHPTYENEELRACYAMKCALLDEDACVCNCEGVIAYTLSNESLGKIANGIFDTDYTRAFGKALLSGKKVFVPEEEIELFKYKETAPKAYYARLEQNLSFLKENGVVVVPNKDLVGAIMGSEPGKCAAETTCSVCTEEKVLVFTKKVLSERNLKSAKEEKYTKIAVSRKSIVTDLARDYAKKYSIVIEVTD